MEQTSTHYGDGGESNANSLVEQDGAWETKDCEVGPAQGIWLILQSKARIIFHVPVHSRIKASGLREDGRSLAGRQPSKKQWMMIPTKNRTGLIERVSIHASLKRKKMLKARSIFGKK